MDKALPGAARLPNVQDRQADGEGDHDIHRTNHEHLQPLSAGDLGLRKRIDDGEEDQWRDQRREQSKLETEDLAQIGGCPPPGDLLAAEDHAHRRADHRAHEDAQDKGPAERIPPRGARGR